MKKIYLIVFVAALPCLVQGQSAFDALRYSQNFYTGTARSAAMGNAVTALGGDFGSISINPAGSAVYPYSELIFTPALHNSVTQSDYLGNSYDESLTRLGVTNIGYVTSRNTSNYSGVVGFSFGIGYNGLNNYANRMSLSGDTDKSSWLAALAYNTGGIHAKEMDWNDNQNPFYTSSASWRALLAWNSSLLDTIPNSGGRAYIGATEAFFGNEIGIPGSLRQDFTRKTVGNSGEYVFNFGLNISHRLFLGVNLGVQSILYDTWEQFSESARNVHDFAQTEFKSFTHTYHQKTIGTGINLKFGAILVPVDNFRLGFSISTPTWMSLTEEWDETIDAKFSAGYNPPVLESPLGEYEFKVTTPYRLNVGAAFTFGSLGAISADYERVEYNKIHMSSTGVNNPFIDQNNYIKKEYTSANNFRAGLELNLNREVSLRGGYAFYGNPEKNWGFDTQIASLGIGIQSGSFFSDLTFMHQFAQNEKFSLYDDVTEGTSVVYPAPIGEQKMSNWKLLLSLGFRF